MKVLETGNFYPLKPRSIYFRKHFSALKSIFINRRHTLALKSIFKAAVLTKRDFILPFFLKHHLKKRL